MQSTTSTNTETHPNVVGENTVVPPKILPNPSTSLRTRKKKAEVAIARLTGSKLTPIPLDRPATMSGLAFTAAAGTFEQAMAKPIAKPQCQSNCIKMTGKPANSENAAASGGKCKHEAAAPDPEVVQARPQKGKTVQAVGAASTAERRVTCVQTGAGKNTAGTDGPVLDCADDKSSKEESLQVTIGTKPRCIDPRGIPTASATPKMHKPVPKCLCTAFEEDPFEMDEKANVSNVESNQNEVDATSGNEDENHSESEDGLDGENIGDILSAEASTTPTKYTKKAKSTKGKGKAVEKKVANRDPRPKCFPKAPIVPIHRLMPTDTMDILSRSEFEPEDDEEAVDEDVEEDNEEERQVWAVFVATRAARKNKNKARPHLPTVHEQVECPVWKKDNKNIDAGPSSSSLPPLSSAALSVPVATIFSNPPAVTSAPTHEAHSFDEDEDDEDVENIFRPDNNVIGGLIMDPTAAPMPMPQPIPPIIVLLLQAVVPQAPVGVMPVPVAQALQAPYPQANIPNVLPPQAYVIVPNAGGGGPQLNPQHIHIVRTIRASIPLLEIYLTTELAFPDSFTASQFISTTLITSATNLGFTGLVVCICQATDQDFLRVMVVLTKQRISAFQSAVKKSADAHVLAYYRLGSKPKKTQERVSSLFEHLKYIYLFTEKDAQLSVMWKKPYFHECITAVLRATFTTGTNSLIIQHPKILLSTYPKRPNKCEVPMVMLALVGTAIHAALSDWKIGTHKPASFTADAYINIYKEHMTLLQGIKEGSANAYHKMIHTLYNRVSGYTAPAAVVESPGRALAHVDIDGMDIDSD